MAPDKDKPTKSDSEFEVLEKPKSGVMDDNNKNSMDDGNTEILEVRVTHIRSQTQH